MLLLAGQEVEELLDRLQQYCRISVVEMCSGQEIGANHLRPALFADRRSQPETREETLKALLG